MKRTATTALDAPFAIPVGVTLTRRNGQHTPLPACAFAREPSRRAHGPTDLSRSPAACGTSRLAQAVPAPTFQPNEQGQAQR